MGLRLRRRPAARRALHRHRQARVQIGLQRSTGKRWQLSIQYRRPLCAERPPGHLGVHRRGAALRADAQRRRHHGQPGRARLVRGRRRGRAHPCALGRGRAAHRAAEAPAPGQGCAKGSAALRHAGLRAPADGRQPHAAGLRPGRGHAQRRGQPGGAALRLQRARALHGAVFLRARERPGRLPAHPAAAPDLQRARARQAGARHPPEGRGPDAAAAHRGRGRARRRHACGRWRRAGRLRHLRAAAGRAGQLYADAALGLQGRLGARPGQRPGISAGGGHRPHAAPGQVRRRAVRHRRALCRRPGRPGPAARHPAQRRAATGRAAPAAGRADSARPGRQGQHPAA